VSTSPTTKRDPLLTLNESTARIGPSDLLTTSNALTVSIGSTTSCSPKANSVALTTQLQLPTAIIKCDQLLESIDQCTTQEEIISTSEQQQIQHKLVVEERKSKCLKGIEKHNRLVELSRKEGSTEQLDKTLWPQLPGYVNDKKKILRTEAGDKSESYASITANSTKSSPTPSERMDRIRKVALNAKKRKEQKDHKEVMSILDKFSDKKIKMQMWKAIPGSKIRVEKLNKNKKLVLENFSCIPISRLTSSNLATTSINQSSNTTLNKFILSNSTLDFNKST
jgi:hypothetical protein